MDRVESELEAGNDPIHTDAETRKHLSLIRSLTERTRRDELIWRLKYDYDHSEYLHILETEIETKAAGKMSVLIFERLPNFPNRHGRYETALQLVLFSTNVDRFEISATPSDDTSEFQELASLLEAAWEPIETERTREESEYLQEKRKKKEIMARGIDEIIGDGGLTV